MKSSRLWNVLGPSALAATLVLVGGFVYAVKDMQFTSRTEAPATQEARAQGGGLLAEASTIKVTAIGDSLSKGTGDDTGEGYVKQVIRRLGEVSGKPVQQINNLAVNGLTAARLEQMLKTDKGLAYPIKQANLVLLTIGGNDLFQTALQESNKSSDDPISVENVAANIPAAVQSFKSIISSIRSLNPDATIVYSGLYNPFYDIPELRPGIIPVQTWNDAAFRVLQDDPHAVLVPTLDLFQQQSASYLSSDHFHPNHKGYERIAERIVQALS